MEAPLMGRGVAARPYAALKAFLEDSQRPKDTLRYHELQGFFFTIASAPELVRPSEWLPVIFGEASAGYQDLEEAQLILGELMALYNSVNAGVFNGEIALPRDCRFRRDVLANLEDDAPIAQWSRGFLAGHQWLEELWEIVPEEMDEAFAEVLITLSFFATPTLAEAYRAETGVATMEELATAVRRSFRRAMADYAWLGRAIEQARAEQARAEREPVRRSQPKTGRNDSCPCGSGRKFKKCCGAATAH